jgi:hypothetical protein
MNIYLMDRIDWVRIMTAFLNDGMNPLMAFGFMLLFACIVLGAVAVVSRMLGYGRQTQ